MNFFDSLIIIEKGYDIFKFFFVWDCKHNLNRFNMTKPNANQLQYWLDALEVVADIEDDLLARYLFKPTQLCSLFHYVLCSAFKLNVFSDWNLSHNLPCNFVIDFLKVL